ncbi:MAG: 4-hydroxythreonine-4-phosphate dehydrogenase PdxA [Pseudomonadota bacterium]|nr:4-hydroxythreonine-4-phosphate dehydrogenase PdxA [Pseudomonadota bacterium]
MTPTLAFTPGEPAGIGPDLAIRLAQESLDAALAVIADPKILRARAEQLGARIEIRAFDGTAHQPGSLSVLPVTAPVATVAGELDTRQAQYVLAAIARAVDGCLAGEFDAMITGPVHKGVINEADIHFSGHTEFIAGRCGATQPVMMLADEQLRVALLTTHLALAEVPAQITGPRIESVVKVLVRGLRRRFGLEQPRIGVCGLNPHAGEGGHLGREEIEIIEPALAALRKDGLRLIGPLPADTAFTPAQLERLDAVLAMYHDQGLPVIKHQGFGSVVNVTLGLPIIRTSVDHGTALDLAGSGRARHQSLLAALRMAASMARQ